MILRGALLLLLLATPAATAGGRVSTLTGRFDPGGLHGEEAARDFLTRHAELLALRSDLDDLKRARHSVDRGGSVLTFQQEHRGVPVFDGMVLVGLDPEEAVRYVKSDYVPDLDSLVPDTTPVTKPAQALLAAGSALGAPLAGQRATSRLVIVEGDKEHPGFHLSWEIGVYLEAPPGDWHVFVDARTGELVRVLDRLKKAAGPCVPCDPATDFTCGLVLHTNPVDALDNTALLDGSNVDSAQQGCSLHSLTSAIRLDGLYANTSRTASRKAPPYSATRSQSQPALDEVNVYYHLTRAKEYLNLLGFPGVMNFSINADAHDGSLGDNSQYVPSGHYLEFGQGGVDDAQDSDVIYHEYGHAIQDNEVPGYGDTLEGGATGEGFGDYWAAAITDASFATSLGAQCVASWDAVSYNPYSGVAGSGCLRRVDGTKQYPREIVYEVHADGEIWSSALRQMRTLVGPQTGDAIVIKSHTFLTPSANFINAADALIVADATLNGGANAAAIHGAMASRGIPRTAPPASSSQMSMTAPFLCETTHNYINGEYKECRFTQPGASRLRFHFSRLETEAGFDFILISDAAYNQVQSVSGAPFGRNNPGVSAAVPGDTIVARFRADPAVRDYGFIIDRVEYVAGAGSVGDGSGDGDPGLSVDTAPGGDLKLSWGPSCASGDTDYEINEGTLGDYVSHLPIACSTGGLTSRTITPSGGSSYYLIVPRNLVGEGSYGTRSDGTQHPRSSNACLPSELATTCQ